MAVADIARRSFSQLQLTTLRMFGAMVTVSLGMRVLFPSPGAESGLALGRLIMVLFAVLVTVVPTEKTVARYGIVMAVTSKVLTTLKSLSSPPEEVGILTAVFGFHRLLPFCSAVFGGVPLCLATTLWTTAEVVGITLWRRVQLNGGEWEWPTPTDVLNWYRTDREAAVVWTELNLVWMATGLACAIVQTHHQTISQLVEALLSRQRFISNMVRAQRGCGGAGHAGGRVR